MHVRYEAHTQTAVWHASQCETSPNFCAGGNRDEFLSNREAKYEFRSKGGHYEKDVLANLTIPGVNLENFGCPKAGELIPDLVWLESCGNHTVPDAFAHCPKVEVEAYGLWLEKQ